jgi:hypothetical protein
MNYSTPNSKTKGLSSFSINGDGSSSKEEKKLQQTQSIVQVKNYKNQQREGEGSRYG